jgi:hypothetical protein
MRITAPWQTLFGKLPGLRISAVDAGAFMPSSILVTSKEGEPGQVRHDRVRHMLAGLYTLGHQRGKNHQLLNDAHRGKQRQVAKRHIHKAVPQ